MNDQSKGSSSSRKGQVNNPEGINQYTKKDGASGSSSSKSNNSEGHNQYTNNSKKSK